MAQHTDFKDSTKLMEEMVQLRENVYREGKETFDRWEPGIKNTKFVDSARNLAFYLALRRRDIRELQTALMPWGLSSLGRSESHTMDNLDAVVGSLSKINGEKEDEKKFPSPDSYFQGSRNLEENADNILGKSPENKSSRIMVTFPTEAARSKKLVENLLKEGMSVARINCAHDNPRVWEKMIQNIRKAEEKLGKTCKIMMDIAGPKIRIDRLYTTLKKPLLYKGDTFFLTGEESLQNFYGNEIVLGCSIPEIVSSLEEGETVLIDDGKIEGEVKSVKDDGVIVKVKKLQTKKGVKIKAEKGLNFPNSNYDVEIFTDKDKQDLDFVCQNADIIGCSFVRHPEDIHAIQDEIRKRLSKKKASNVALMLKLETAQGVQDLPEIIVAAASQNPLCVMVARGDLAVEIGYLRLAEIQEEILWICEAADVPVIWATQVMENMMKTGVPSRAEITDAAQGSKAECIMLNKGEYVLDVIRTLDEILEKMQEHQYKKMPRLRALNLAETKD